MTANFDFDSHRDTELSFISDHRDGRIIILHLKKEQLLECASHDLSAAEHLAFLLTDVCLQDTTSNSAILERPCCWVGPFMANIK